MKKKSKVLLIGWDAADWKIIDKLMANGLMPAMKSVVDGGVRGQLATLDPPLSPMLWTSMATGVRPYKHGVLGFVEGDGTGGVRPVSSHSRKVKAIWNMLTMEGYKSNVVGWWPSNPVETINGCMVSNLFQQEKKGKLTMDVADWDVPEGTIYPESLIDRLKELRVHPHEITGNLIMPFVPQALKLDKKEDKRLTVIAKFLAHASTVHAVTTELMETEEWDFTTVYHDAIDHFCHAFMKFHPPKMEGMEDESFEIFKDVVVGAYIFHDMMLERMLGMIDDDTTVVIVSDHGFHSDHLRPTHVPEVPSGPAVEHAPFGIFVAKGPGIKKGERVYGASILDVTPTLLTLFNMPVGRDMDGKPLIDIYESPKEIEYIESWEKVDKFGGEFVLKSAPDEATNQAALQQLIDLGYINDMKIEGDPDENSENYLKGVIKENNLYLAKSYISGGQYEEGLEILLEIENKEKPDFRILLDIVGAAVKTKRFALAQEYITYIRANDLIEANYINVLEAKVQLGLNEPAKTVGLLREAMKHFPNSTDILVDTGRLMNTLGQYDEARKCFQKVVELDPGNAYGFHGLGVVALRKEEYELALGYFLDSIERIYFYPFAHFHLGETFALMKDYNSAIEAFEVVASIAPQMPKTYRWLLDLYEITGNEDKISHYRKIVDHYNLGEKIIVTGLPGVKLVETIERIESHKIVIGGYKDDLHGEKISILNPNWFADLGEKVNYIPLKMIGSLPPKYSYRFLFVNDEAENVMSYLQSLIKLKENSYSPDLMEAILRQESVAQTWMSQQPNLDLLYIKEVNEVDTDLIVQFLS